jgi:hypothetical protein
VTSTLYNGNLGGLAGADGDCNARAQAAGLSGTYRAWASDPSGSPSTRFSKTTDDYVLVDGTVVAHGYAGLTSGSLLHGITLNESGQAAAASVGVVFDREGGAEYLDDAAASGTSYAWTDTNPDGTFHVDGLACDYWTAGPLQGGEFGTIGATGPAWTVTGYVPSGSCAKVQASLYCFEQ